MEAKSWAIDGDSVIKRHIPNAIYEEGMKQFPKRCKKCHRVFYDFSDWFIDHSLGVPMPFKSSSLLFFRACQCHNTLAVAVDFGSCLKSYQEEHKNDKIIDFGSFRNVFVSEIPLWKRETGNLVSNRNIMINVSDAKLIERILGFSPGELTASETGDSYVIKIPQWENVDMHVYDSVDAYKSSPHSHRSIGHLLACGIFYFTRADAHNVFKVIQEIKAVDSNFQVVTVSDEVESVSEFGFDDNFHYTFSDKTETIPFLIVNRLNSYFYMQ